MNILQNNAFYLFLFKNLIFLDLGLEMILFDETEAVIVSFLNVLLTLYQPFDVSTGL